MSETNNTPVPKLSKAEVTELAASTPKIAGIGKFAQYMQHNMPSLRRIAASHMSPERLYRIVLNAVSRTPMLAECTMESLLTASLQASELGLEPGSALGECYFVPYNKNVGTKANPKWAKEAQFQPGYRGLISLAFRSGYVVDVKANVVYQGDTFEYEEGLEPKLRHIPDYAAQRDPAKITFAYCIMHLKDGGRIYDVMTRGEVDAIRNRSKSGSDGPWVTDYAEMAKKTVCRRCSKYAPMSVEMSKAIAADTAVETGDFAILAEFESIELPEALPEPDKSDKLTEKIGTPPPDQDKKDVAEQEGVLIK